jgi:hypothetical protein
MDYFMTGNANTNRIAFQDICMPFCASQTSIFNPSDYTDNALACCRYSCLIVH